MSDDKKKCPKCGDRFRVRTSLPLQGKQLQYLRCTCGNTCKALVETDAIFRRTSR